MKYLGQISDNYDIVNKSYVDSAAFSVLPSVTSSDNGKVLKVVNGSWTLSDAGGGGSNKETEILNRTISGSYENSTITNLGSYAFAYCSSLEAVSMPNCSYISYQAFASCYKLTSAYFPNVIMDIALSAFYSCSKLSYAYFPRASRVMSSAFYGCYSLNSTNFDNVSTVFSSAFRFCSSLSTISLPSCKIIYSYAFANTGLTEISLPNISTISNWAFQSCTSLVTVSLGTVSTIKSLTLSSGVFSNCTNLASVTLNNCSYIYSSAFYNCSKLLYLKILAPDLPSVYVNAFNSTPLSENTTQTGGVYGSIYVPSSLYASYIAATNWAHWSSRIVSI